MAIFIVNAVAVMELSESSRITVKNIVLPPGVYKLKVTWGDFIYERMVEVKESPQSMSVDVPGSNIRSCIDIALSAKDYEVLRLRLKPTAFGYEVSECLRSEHVCFENPSDAVEVEEVVSAVKALIHWSPRGGKVVKVLINNVTPPVLDIDDCSIQIGEFVVDDEVVVEVEMEGMGKIYADFRLGKRGLDVAASFNGDFTSAKVNYAYSVKKVLWTIAIPITTPKGGKELFTEQGEVLAKKGEEEVRTTPTPTPKLTSGTEPSLTQQVESLEQRLKATVKDFRYELLTLAAILVAAGMVKRLWPLTTVGIIISAITLVIMFA